MTSIPSSRGHQPSPHDAPATPPLTLSPAHQTSLAPYLPPSTPARTHLTLTYAQSLDAQISLSPGTPTILSGPTSKAMTHFLRAHHAALLIGVTTAEADDPSLNCRFADASDPSSPVGLSQQPRPIILDPAGRWTCRKEAKVLRLARAGRGKGPLWMVHAANAHKVDAQRLEVLKAAGGELLARDEFWEEEKGGFSAGGVEVVSGRKGGVQWGVVLRRLWIQGVSSVMVEGGGAVIRDLLRVENQELVDSVVVTIAPVWLGKGGVTVVPDRASMDEELGSERERAGLSGEGVGEGVGRLEGLTWVAMGEDVVLAGRFKLPRTTEEELL